MSKTIWALGDAGLKSPIAKQLGEMILADSPDHFMYLGDVYESGLESEFEIGYEPNFGSLKDITWPICGNHCWGHDRKSCEGWKAYWDDHPNWYNAGTVAGWMILMLDSEMDCHEGSDQWKFVLAEITAWEGPVICGIHRPRWSAGKDKIVHGDQPQLQDIYDLLSRRSCLVLSGHEHNLQSIKQHGKVRQLIVGAGGHPMAHPIDRGDPRLEWGTDKHYGAVKISVSAGHCIYEFIGVKGDTLHRGQWNHNGSSGIIRL